MKARTSSRNVASSGDRASSTEATSPLLTERTDFQFEGPGALRLLIELPVGLRHRCRRHQEVGIVERVRPERFDPPLTHPFGVDAGIDDEMGDMNILRSKLARRRLRDGPQSELGAGERGIADAAAERGGCTGEEDVALAARQHQLCRLT